MVQAILVNKALVQVRAMEMCLIQELVTVLDMVEPMQPLVMPTMESDLVLHMEIQPSEQAPDMEMLVILVPVQDMAIPVVTIRLR